MQLTMMAAAITHLATILRAQHPVVAFFGCVLLSFLSLCTAALVHGVIVWIAYAVQVCAEGAVVAGCLYLAFQVENGSTTTTPTPTPTPTSVCMECDGNGIVVQLRQLGPGFMQRVQTRCPQCKGTEGKASTKHPTPPPRYESVSPPPPPPPPPPTRVQPMAAARQTAAQPNATVDNLAPFPTSSTPGIPKWCSKGATVRYNRTRQLCTVTAVSPPMPGDTTTYVSVALPGGIHRETTLDAISYPASAP